MLAAFFLMLFNGMYLRYVLIMLLEPYVSSTWRQVRCLGKSPVTISCHFQCFFSSVLFK